MSDYNGCGWIAAYNYLRLCGKTDLRWSDVVSGMQNCTLLFGYLGTDPFALRRYLNRQGCGMKTAFRPRAASEAAERAGRGILMYWHGSGAHFTAFERLEDKTRGVLFLNLGGARLYPSFDAMLAANNKGKLVCLLYPAAAPAKTSDGAN